MSGGGQGSGHGSGHGDVWSFSQHPGSPLSTSSSSAQKQKRGSKIKRPSIRQSFSSSVDQSSGGMVMADEDDGLDIQSISLVQGAEFLYDWEEEREKEKRAIKASAAGAAGGAAAGGGASMVGGGAQGVAVGTESMDTSVTVPPVKKRTISLESFNIIKVIGKGCFVKSIYIY